MVEGHEQQVLLEELSIRNTVAGRGVDREEKWSSGKSRQAEDTCS